jgi:hypothetical protein
MRLNSSRGNILIGRHRPHNKPKFDNCNGLPTGNVREGAGEVQKLLARVGFHKKMRGKPVDFPRAGLFCLAWEIDDSPQSRGLRL